MDSQFTLLGEKIDAVYYLLKDRPPCNCGLIEPLIPWLSRQEVMDHLKISNTTYYEWRKKGILQEIGRASCRERMADTVVKIYWQNTSCRCNVHGLLADA